MTRFTSEQIIKGIKNRDNAILHFIYKKYYSTILKFVLNNSGSTDDAKDIFQESIIIAYKNIKKTENFKLSCNFETYLYSIARLLWLKNLRNLKNDPTIPLIDNHSFIYFEEPEPFNEEDIRFALFQKAFLSLPADCRKIIKMSMDGYPQKEIVKALGLKSENYVRKRKHYCKEYLIRKIKEDPQYREFDI